MRITELFTAQSIALDEALTDQEQIISRLVELQATHGNITDKDAYKKALYAREAEGGLLRLQAARCRPEPSGTSCDTGAADSRTPICGGSACRAGRCPFPDAGASCVQTGYL